MVTHVPPSPSFSSASFSQRAQSTSSSISPYHRRPYPTYPPSAAHAVTRLPPSQPPPPPTPPYAHPPHTPSRDPSVSSRASTSGGRDSHRRHHNHRHAHTASGAGASSSRTASQNEFPWFSQSGDVEILIGDRSGRREQRYLLHSLILSQTSRFFSEEMGHRADVNNVTGGSQRGRQLARIRERSTSRTGSAYSSGSYNSDSYMREQRRRYYELDWSQPSDSSEGYPILIPKRLQETPTSRRGPPSANTSLLRNLANTFSQTSLSHAHRRSSSTSLVASKAEDADILDAYDNLFRTFYNHAPHFSTDNIATSYVECKTFLSLASLYGALPVTGPRVDHHLLRFGSRLWRQVAKYPPSYLKLAHLSRSHDIFSEALIHVVGQWPAGSAQLRRGTVDDALLDLIEDKVEELDELKGKVDAKLFRISLTISRGERVAPGNAWLDWLAVSLFRDWFAEHTTPPPPSILKESSRGHYRDSHSSREQRRREEKYNPGRTYKFIATAGQSYLQHDSVKRFLKQYHPASRDFYNRENVRRLERAVEEVKNLARDAVKPLTRSFLQDRNGGAFEHLTCTRVEDRDLEFVWGVA